MKSLITDFTLQLRDALQIGNTMPSAMIPHDPIHHVVIGGMGGSGIGGDFMEAVCRLDISVPLFIHKDYSLATFVSTHTLFIACSYSGNTEETLTSAEEARLRGATVVCITSGGTMMEWAKKYELTYLSMPSGCASPRAMVGYAISFLFFTLHSFHLIKNHFIYETNQAISLLDNAENDIQKQAKEIADKLVGKLPIIYCSENTKAVALRFQQQINENANHLAHINVFPEMNHNEIVGWEHPEKIMAYLQPIYLRTDYEHVRVKKRMAICQRIIEKKSLPIIEVYAQGKSLVEHHYYLLHLTDWISYFLAKKNNVDPTFIESIIYLKQELHNIS